MTMTCPHCGKPIQVEPAAMLRSVNSEAQKKAARANGAKGGRPRKDPAAKLLPMTLAVTKDGKPRTLKLSSGGGAQYEVVIVYPDGQQVRAKVQPTEGGGVPDLRFYAEKNGFAY